MLTLNVPAFDIIINWLICLLQERSHTSASGPSANGVSRDPTSWPDTTENTRAPSPSDARCARDPSPGATILLYIWKDTCPKHPNETSANHKAASVMRPETSVIQLKFLINNGTVLLIKWSNYYMNLCIVFASYLLLTSLNILISVGKCDVKELIF